MDYPIISADSHITEPPNTYVDYIEAKWKAKAPQMKYVDKLGDAFFVEGLPSPVPMGLVAAAGKPPEEIRTTGVRFEEMHRGGWDPEARMAEQARDGVAAEVIYPTVGMVICNHPDFEFKEACFAAYNRWLAEYCGAHPTRLLGSRVYDPFWEKAIELGLPLSFHILTDRSYAFAHKTRGPKMNGFLSIMRGCQDVMGTLVLGGVFERHPQLKVVCVEADAGWVPHYMYRMDHAYKRHRNWLPAGALSKLPSEYFRENIYVTFQDDWVAFQMKDMCNFARIMWANDFPHSDSTWPWSQEMLAEHTKHLSEKEKNMVLHDNVAELYQLDAR
jgi:predicted TIM-barrel fold metal-dependent hydrolase